MKHKMQPNRDEQIFGMTSYQVVRSDTADLRTWLQEAPVCSLLKIHHIAHIGIMHATYPFRVSRINPNGTYMMVSMERRGEVWIDGKSEFLEEGQACLLPPFVMNRFECIPATPWKFCWIRYSESRETAPFISSSTPVMRNFAHEPLVHAILGLRAEVMTRDHPQVQENWVNLLHRYVIGFAQPQHRDERLVKLWQLVEKDLARCWTIESMAGVAHVSSEHLRRLCWRHLGRSPLQHLTFLRIQRAQRLLSSTNEKIETIANAVGYESAFTFSNCFKKWVGWRPSEYR
jgi:AraC-like DNA-binding protein